MRTLFLACLLSVGGLTAQTFEVGVFLGGANGIGDVGRTNYVLPSDVAYGALFKWNKRKQYAFRFSWMRGNIKFDDSKSSKPSREQRGYETENIITEFSLGIEYNFLEYNLHKLGPAFTPYLYTGVTYFRYDFNYFDNNGTFQELDQREGAFSIPMTVGMKIRLTNHFILGAEVGARYTFTDNLDASNPEGSNFEMFRFGNILSEDWYVFSGLTLTYTFGRKPCQDCFE